MAKITHRTLEQFLNAPEIKISELNGYDVDSATNVSNIPPKLKMKSVKSSELDVDKERYLHDLIGDIQSEFIGIVDSMKFDAMDDSLIITVVLGDEVREFSVPYSDLKFDWNNIDEDTQYISNEIDEEFNREYIDDTVIESSVNSASSRFSKVLGSADYYDHPNYSKTLYLPSTRQGKVKLTIGTFSDPSYEIICLKS